MTSPSLQARLDTIRDNAVRLAAKVEPRDAGDLLVVALHYLVETIENLDRDNATLSAEVRRLQRANDELAVIQPGVVWH